MLVLSRRKSEKKKKKVGSRHTLAIHFFIGFVHEPLLATIWNYLFGGTTPCYHLELPLWWYHSLLPSGTTSLEVPPLATTWNYLFGGTTPGYHLELPFWWYHSWLPLELPLWWYHSWLPPGTTSVVVPLLATTWNYLCGGITPGYHLELPLWWYHSWLTSGP